MGVQNGVKKGKKGHLQLMGVQNGVKPKRLEKFKNMFRNKKGKKGDGKGKKGDGKMNEKGEKGDGKMKNGMSLGGLGGMFGGDGGGGDNGGGDNGGIINEVYDNASSRVIYCLVAIKNIFLKVWEKKGELLHSLCEVLKSLLFIVVAVLVVYLIYYMVNKRHLRMFQLYRSVNFEDFSFKYSTDVLTSIEQIQTQLSDPDVAGALSVNASKLSSSISSLMGSRSVDEVRSDLNTYFRFENSLRMLTLAGKADILYNTDRFTTDGLVDKSLVDEFLKNVGDPVDAIFDASKSFSEHFEENMRTHEDPSTVKKTYVFRSHVHNLKLQGSYLPRLKVISSMRSKGSGLAIQWLVRYGNLIEDWWRVNVPNSFKEFPTRFMDTLKLMLEKWQSLGQSLAKIPCNVSYLDDAERKKHCEGFQGSKAKDSGDDDDDEEIREGFIGFLKSIADFFTSLVDVAMAIASLFANFPKDPVGTIIGLLCIIIGVVVGLILIIVYAIFTILGLAYVIAFMVAWAWALVVPVAMVLFYLLLSIIFVVPFFLLFIIDLMLGGALIRLFACETLPSEWVDNANYIYDNYYERSIAYIGLVMKPCTRRFRPVGVFCERMRPDMPDYCPHQLIYKMFSGNKLMSGFTLGPTVFDRFRSSDQYKMHHPETKRKFVRDSWKTKVMWNKKCTDVFSDYNYIVKHVCLDPSQTATTPGEEDTLRSLCKDAFCSTSDLVNSTSNKSFCSDIEDPSMKDDEYIGNSSPGTAEIFKQTCSVMMFTISVVIVMMSLFTISQFIGARAKRGVN